MHNAAQADRRAHHLIRCPRCRRHITTTPILSYDTRARVEEMARGRGIPIPPFPPFHWPAHFNVWLAPSDDDDDDEIDDNIRNVWLRGQAVGWW